MSIYTIFLSENNNILVELCSEVLCDKTLLTEKDSVHGTDF